MFGEIAAKVAFSKTLDELVKFLKEKSSGFAKLKNINVDDAYLKAANVEFVKTIWQTDKNVNLNEFYYPSKLNVDSSRVTISSLHDLPENGKIVVQGTAGQGKSIFLRYLAGKELREGQSIPIFIELRKITERTRIEDLIIEAVHGLGIECDHQNLKYIFESGKCSLLLDAFDEIKEDQVLETISYIEGLCGKYHNLKIIITSRANAGIQNVNFFNVYDLSPLNPSDFPPMLEKFFKEDDDVNANDIVEAIHKNKSGIAELITTPLLLTLLTITYRSYHKIPEKLHEFYDNLFYLLVNRHDSTKPGFRREFKSGLNENELEKLFCAFCFYCTIKQKSTLSVTQAVELVGEAKKITDMTDVCENSFLEDTKNNTCLIIEEGFEYHFIHKSIREYHSASFISNSPEQLKEKFYNLALSKPGMYKQEIIYLRSIDTYYCNKFYDIPTYEYLFTQLNFTNNQITIDDVELNNLNISISDGSPTSMKSNDLEKTLFFRDPYIDIVFSIFHVLEECKLKPNFQTGAHKGGIFELYEEEATRDKINNKVLEFVKENHTKYMEIKDYISNQDSAIENIGF